MRPWLVVLGASLLLIGVGALSGLLFLPPTGVRQQSTSQLVGHATPPGTLGTFLISGVADHRGTVALNWSSTGPVSVQFEPATCSSGTTPCSGPVLREWPRNTSGTYSWSGPLDGLYQLTWVTPPRVFANVSASAVVSWTVIPPTSVAEWTAEVASGLLAVVGGIGLFLGVFLRGNYRIPPPTVSRHAEDAEAIGAFTDPRTGTPADGSGPPRRGPPSRSA